MDGTGNASLDFHGSVDLDEHSLTLETDNQFRRIQFLGLVEGTGGFVIRGHTFRPVFVFSQSNTFSGGLATREGEVDGADIRVRADQALGTGVIELSQRRAQLGTRAVEFNADAGPVTLPNDFIFRTRSNQNQPHSLTMFSGDTITLTGNIELNSANTVNETYLQSDGEVVFAGII